MKKSDKIRLILPSPEMKNRVMAFREAFFAAGEKSIPGGCGLDSCENFNDWMDILLHPDKTGEFLLSTSYLGIRKADNAIVGITNIRHYLDETRYHYGHIGYSVHPQERHKGYGKEILRLALIKADEMGIIEPVVSCNKGNRISRVIIEKNGLQFEKEHIESDGEIVQVFKIKTD